MKNNDLTLTLSYEERGKNQIKEDRGKGAPIQPVEKKLEGYKAHRVRIHGRFTNR
jgi:hypothetical protein